MNSTVIGPGWEASVTVNPVNPSNILVTGGGIQNSDYFTVATASSDGGRTWRNGFASYSYLNSVFQNGWTFFDKVGTFDASGNAYVGTITNGTMDWLFKSSDSGNSWLLTSPSLKMNDSLLDYGTGAMVLPCNNPPAPTRDYPAVIADPYSASPYRNNVYVLVRTGAQVSPTSCPYGEAFERSTDGGKTWGSGIWLGPPGFGSDISLADNRGMALAPDGTVFLALATNPYQLLTSTDGGVSFQETSIVAPHITNDRIEVAGASATTIYALLYGDNLTAGCCGEHLYSVVSHDGGTNWSAPVRIDDVTYPDSTHVAGLINTMWDFSFSQQTGRLDVAWLDLRNDAGNLTLADIYYSYSFDGLSWATNTRATQGPYYYCAISSSFSCSGAGNDFMWVTSSHTPIGDSAYIVASVGATPCGIHCTNVSLYTRFVKVTFPPPPNTADALHVTNAAIQNSKGRNVTLVGLNYGDYPYDVLPNQFNTGNLTQDAVNIKKAGFNEVNLVEEWGHLESS